MRRLFTFEDSLLPQKERRVYALGNVAADALFMPNELMSEFVRVADSYYRGWRIALAMNRILAMNLFLPGVCNATCPKICFTDWKGVGCRGYDEKFLCNLLRQFARLGGRVVRVIGLGEPTISKLFFPLCRLTKELEIQLVVFTNGIVMSDGVYEEYAHNQFLHFYVKHWSDDVKKQNRLVAPQKCPYVYKKGRFGMASRVFYDLHELNECRVGFQVIWASFNESEAQRIINGPKFEVPMFVEPFFPAGQGVSNKRFIPVNVPGVDHSWPTRASYMAVVGHHGELKPGTFITSGAILMPLQRGGLKMVWSRAYTAPGLFFESRYQGLKNFSETILTKAD